MKSYTDIEQSKVLAKILPLESADMYYFRQIDNDYFLPNVESICPIPLFKDGREDFKYDIPCWSLAALLNILSHPTLEGKSYGWRCNTYGSNKEGTVYLGGQAYDNPIDACYNMVLRLHELEML